MGLDIYAYRKLVKLTDVITDSDGEPVNSITREPVENYFRVYANPDFPGRADGLEDRAFYGYVQAEHVFSRSYRGYNIWRNTLAKLAGYPLTHRKVGVALEESHAAAAWSGNVQAGAPFFELVNFADNEGTIGPVVAAKLLADFVAFDERAKAVAEDFFYVGYCDLMYGLEIAADGGALDFH